MHTLVAASLLIALVGPAGAQVLHDSFEQGAVDARRWSSRQIHPHQVDFVSPGRCGTRALSVRTLDADAGRDCDAGEVCQRAELRTARPLWPDYDGKDVWFAFSFRIEGEMPTSGSDRTIVGQWKAPGDDSPFVAQRFDDGIFHITVQDGEKRRTVASSAEDPGELLVAQAILSGLNRNDPGIVKSLLSLQSLYRLKRSEPEVSARFFSGELQEALRPGTTDNAPSNDLARSLQLPSRLVSAFHQLSYIAEPTRYLGPADIEIVGTPKRLPDPRLGWVDMLYRIRGGRTDNEYGPKQKGELEVWANGERITLVRGNLGYQLKRAQPIELAGPYFKFGLYRKKVPGIVSVHFDEFSQARKRSDLGAICPAN